MMPEVKGNCEIAELKHDEGKFNVMVERKSRKLSINK